MCTLNEIIGPITVDKKTPKEAYRWFSTTSDGLIPVAKSNSRVWHKKVAKANQPPTNFNRNGLYMYKTVQDAMVDHSSIYVLAKVRFWGTCIEHSNGYRAQYAEIVEIYPTKQQEKVSQWEQYTVSVVRKVPKTIWVKKRVKETRTRVKATTIGKALKSSMKNVKIKVVKKSDPQKLLDAERAKVAG
jgi:hypothetical protein